MNTFKNRVFLLLVTVFMLIGIASAQSPVSPKDLPNFATVNANFYRGGQPSEAGVKELARIGVKTIINLRGADKSSDKEKLWAQNAGIKFVAVNLSNWFKPKNADIEAVIREIDANPNQPVFVHCKRGADRTGTVVAVYRISHDGWTAKQANAEAAHYHFGWWQFRMKDYIEDYYEQFLVKK